MSVKAQRHTKVLSLQLKQLEGQRTQLQSVVDFIDSVLVDCEQWMSPHDKDQAVFQEISQKIDKASELVAQKCLEISGDLGQRCDCDSPSVPDDEKKYSPKCNGVMQGILTRLAVLEETISCNHNVPGSKLILSANGSKLQQLRDNNFHLNNFNAKPNFEILFRKQEETEIGITTDIERKNQDVDQPELVMGEVSQLIYQLKSQVDNATKTVTYLNETTLALSKSVKDSEKALESVNKRTLHLEEALDGSQVNYRHRTGGNQQIDPNRAIRYSRYDEIVKDLSLKFEILSSQVQDFTGRTVNGEDPQANSRPAFTAYICSYSPAEQGANIRSFTDVRCNFGGHFNMSTGEFTAPVSGVYAVSVTLWLQKDGRVKVNVINTTADGLREQKVCEAYTCGANVSSSSLGVAEMKPGSRLSVKLVFMTGTSLLSDFTSFSCFRIG